MIVRLSKGMNYSTATRNAKRAASYGLSSRIINTNTGNTDVDYSFEVELNANDPPGLVADMLDLNVFVIEILRYAGVAEVKSEWSEAVC